MFRFINLYSLKKFCKNNYFRGNYVSNGKCDGLVVDETKLEGLVDYIEEDRKKLGVNQRYAEMWYDFLCSCSTKNRRAELDIAALMIQLEGMLYYLLNCDLLNGEFNGYRRTMPYDDVCNLVGYVNNAPEYSMPPLDVKFESALFYIIIALQMPGAKQKVSSLVQDGSYEDEMAAIIDGLQKKEKRNKELLDDVNGKISILEKKSDRNDVRIHKAKLQADILTIKRKKYLLEGIIENRTNPSDKSLKECLVSFINKQVVVCEEYVRECKKKKSEDVSAEDLKDLEAGLEATLEYRNLLQCILQCIVCDNPIKEVYKQIGHNKNKNNKDELVHLYEVLDVLKNILEHDIEEVEQSVNELKGELTDRQNELKAFESTKYRAEYILLKKGKKKSMSGLMCCMVLF